MTTKMDVAKFAADLTVKAVITNVVADLVARNTNLSEDDLVVKVGSAVAGYYAGEALKDRTHAAVEAVADWYTNFRANRTAQKTQA